MCQSFCQTQVPYYGRPTLITSTLTILAENSAKNQSIISIFEHFVQIRTDIY